MNNRIFKDRFLVSRRASARAATGIQAVVVNQKIRGLKPCGS
jgi:hypothetical protein